MAITRSTAERVSAMGKAVWILALATAVAVFGYQRWMDGVPYTVRTLSHAEEALVYASESSGGDLPSGIPQVVLFSRYSCPVSEMAWTRLDSILDTHAASFALRVRHVVHPRDSIAHRRAIGARCIESGADIRLYHSAIFGGLFEQEVDEVEAAAALAGVGDMARYEECLASDRASATIALTYEHAFALRINSVPTLAIGNRLVTGLPPADLIVKWMLTK